MAGRDVPDSVRRWLNELLEAHDADRSLIIDRRIDDLARGLSGAPGGPAPEELVGQQFGPWRAREHVGRGGMGLVLEGERADGRFEMRVAIKVLDPDAIDADAQSVIEQEVRTLAQLEHPGIARLVDGGVREDGVGWLTMEFVDGLALDAWCDRHEPSRNERIALFRQVADAVSYCHRALVAHGDIKPGNILVDDNGRVRLLDFGIAARLADSTSSSTAVEPMRWCSPGYASPERLAGRAPSISDDVFALGALLFRLIAGHGIRSAPEQTRLISGGFTESNGDVGVRAFTSDDADLDAIIGQALTAKPENRYRSVEALLDDLDRWSDGFPVAARKGGSVYRFRRWFGRHRSLATAGVLAVVALLAGTAVAFWQADRARLAADRAERNAQAAEASQARAEATNRFLLDLFEAEIPDLPPDEMPTTRQIVEQGIEQARDPVTGPPEVRADLMLTLAGILLSRKQLDQADVLIEEAHSLVDTEAHQALAIRLAMLDVDRTRLRNEFNAMESALEHAIAMLDRHNPQAIERLEMQRDLGRLHMRREQHERAAEILEDVQRSARSRADTDDLQLRLAGDLAVVAGRSGQFERAISQFEEVLRLKRTDEQVSPLSLATTLVNLAGLHAQIGQYRLAEFRHNEVLDLLEPFGDLPQGTRATSLLGLADIRRWQGRFEEAERLIERSAEEWRRLLDLDTVEEDFFIHYYRAELYGDAHRYQQAAESIEVAIERMSMGQEAPPGRIAEAQADLARYRCEIGQPTQAEPLLDNARSALVSESSRALAEAEAACAMAGLTDVEASIIPDSLIEQARLEPGDVSVIARLEIRRAEQLLSMSEAEGARELVEIAAVRLQASDVVAGHPLLARAERLEQRLDEQPGG
nr:protein kinase [Wenzhouxiangella sp. XN201]